MRLRAIGRAYNQLVTKRSNGNRKRCHGLAAGAPSTGEPRVARLCSSPRDSDYLPTTNVPESAESLYFGSPAGNVAVRTYEPGFWLSLKLTEASPLALVVPIAL